MTQATSNATTELDPNAWLDRHGDVLFRYALARVRDKSRAEDLLQDTVLAAMSAAKSFKGGSTERSWLIGILRHKLLDYFRRTAREREFIQEWANAAADETHEFDEQGSWAVGVGEWGSPEKSLENREFWQVLNGCIDKLPEPLRMPFAMREFEGLDSESIIKTLDISSENNLWVILSRARQRVRGCLQDRWFQEQ